MEIPAGPKPSVYPIRTANADLGLGQVKPKSLPKVEPVAASKNIDIAQYFRLASANPAVSFFETELGSTSSGEKILAGQSLGSFSSEKEALNFAQSQTRLVLGPDLAIIRNPNNTYQVQTLEIPGRFLPLKQNLNSYEAIRASHLNPELTTGQSLVAITADNGSTRFLSGQSSQINSIPAPADPPSISPANLPNSQRLQLVRDLRQKTVQTLSCIQNLAHKLGAQRDHRGIFANVYSAIIERGLKEFDRMVAKGDLRGAEFCGSLYVNFANRYYQAFEAYQKGDMSKVPEAWREAFDSGRLAQSQGYPLASATEILGLSMVAHILNDLPQTLQDIGYPQAEDRVYLEEVFNEFNSHMMAEKSNIMTNIENHYGNTDIKTLDQLGSRLSSLLPGPFSSLNNSTQTSIFTGMRNIAKQAAITGLNSSQIAEQVKPYSSMMRRMPGGNN